MLSAIDKDPDAILPYVFDWTDWLDGDTISKAEVLVSPGDDGGIVVASVSHDDSKVTAWLSGGKIGVGYTVTCRVFPTLGAAQNMQDDRSILVRVRDR
jgi:hypothetical protein